MGSGEQADLSEPRVWQDANAEVSTISPALRPRGGRSSPRGSPVFGSPSMVGTKYSSCGGLLAPTEVGAVHPHAMQDHRQAPTDGNDRLLHATPARDGHPPGLERRPFASPRHQNQGSLVHQRTQIAVTTSRDAPHLRDPSGLVYSRASVRYGRRRFSTWRSVPGCRRRCGRSGQRLDQRPAPSSGAGRSGRAVRARAPFGEARCTASEVPHVLREPG